MYFEAIMRPYSRANWIINAWQAPTFELQRIMLGMVLQEVCSSSINMRCTKFDYITRISIVPHSCASSRWNLNFDAERRQLSGLLSNVRDICRPDLDGYFSCILSFLKFTWLQDAHYFCQCIQVAEKGGIQLGLVVSVGFWEHGHNAPTAYLALLRDVVAGLNWLAVLTTPLELVNSADSDEISTFTMMLTYHSSWNRIM